MLQHDLKHMASFASSFVSALAPLAAREAYIPETNWGQEVTSDFNKEVSP